MAAPARPVIETRYEQMFPTLETAEIDRLRSFGETRTFRAGERLVATGEVSPGMFVILTGEVAITQHNALGHHESIVTHGPGSFVGELAQLSSRPSLVDAHATTAVDCRTCGHVGCCDDSPNRHATKHFHATKHPIIEGYDPPEGWGWCYVDEISLDLTGRTTPQRGPIPRYV